MTTYAVTGATGKLGRLVLDELLTKTDAANVVALARDPTALQKYDQLGVQVHRADYDDPASLDAALQGVDRVLMISGTPRAALRLPLGCRVPPRWGEESVRQPQSTTSA